MQAHDDSYRDLFDSSLDAVLVHVDGRICVVNPAAVSFYKADSAAAMIGLPVTDFVHPEDRPLTETRARSAQR